METRYGELSIDRVENGVLITQDRLVSSQREKPVLSADPDFTNMIGSAR